MVGQSLEEPYLEVGIEQDMSIGRRLQQSQVNNHGYWLTFDVFICNVVAFLLMKKQKLILKHDLIEILHRILTHSLILITLLLYVLYKSFMGVLQFTQIFPSIVVLHCDVSLCLVFTFYKQQLINFIHSCVHKCSQYQQTNCGFCFAVGQ